MFHPQNTYVGVPLIDVLLVPLDTRATAMPLIADVTDRIPRFGMFWDPLAARHAVVAVSAGHGDGDAAKPNRSPAAGCRPASTPSP